MRIQLAETFRRQGPVRANGASGFTLIEVLAVVAIIGVLASLGFVGINKAQESGLRARELAAARSLVRAYLDYAGDNNGAFLPGHLSNADPVRMPSGEEIAGPEADRYPWRLAPYIDWNIPGVYLINRTKQAVAGLDPGSTEYRYLVALAPAMGLNTYCIGGYYTPNGVQCANDVATHLAQVERPSQTLAFVSTHYKTGTQDMEGYFYARPPILGGLKWSGGSYNESLNSDKYGFVHFRHSKRAVCVFLDGHSALLGLDELRDMRLWAPKATSANYTLKL